MTVGVRVGDVHRESVPVKNGLRVSINHVVRLVRLGDESFLLTLQVRQLMFSSSFPYS